MLPGIDTPIGRFQLTCSAVAGEPVCSVIEGGARVWAWSGDGLDAEVWVGRVEPALPEGMAVRDCYAAIWRMRAQRELTEWAFSCLHEGGPVIGAGDHCSGERLEAQEWTRNGFTVTLGTQTVDEPDAGVVEYLPDGFVVRPPALQPNEMIQVQFAVAWVPEDGDSTASWFAVDFTPLERRG